MKQQRKKRNYWSKEMCLAEALKFNSRSKFKKQSPGAFGHAYKNGWIDEICSHMKCLGNRFLRLVYVYEFSDKHVYVGLTYNIEERDEKHKRDKRSKVYQHIKKTKLFPTISYSNFMNVDDAKELEKNTIKKYAKLGYILLNMAKAGGIGAGYIKWTFENCFNEALKFKSRKEFASKNNSAYNSARRYGWLDKVCVHMNTIKNKPPGYWTKEKCSEEAIKYSTRNEFYKKSPGAYGAAFRNGWLKEVCYNMKTKKPNGYWTKKRCLEEVLKYKTRKSFRIENNSVYSLMIRKGWINDIKNLK